MPHIVTIYHQNRNILVDMLSEVYAHQMLYLDLGDDHHAAAGTDCDCGKRNIIATNAEGPQQV